MRDLPEDPSRAGVGDRSVRRLVHDHRQTTVRQPSRGFEGDDTTEAHADHGRRAPAQRIEHGGEIGEMGRDIDRLRLRQATQSTAPAVHRDHGHVAHLGQRARQSVQLFRGRERSMQQQHRHRAGTHLAVRDEHPVRAADPSDMLR